MTVEVQKIDGECKGMQDCAKKIGKPAKELTAPYCLVKNGGSDFALRPTTVCSNCLPGNSDNARDVRCPEEYYCQGNDQGYCQNDLGFYVCDGYAASSLGRCKEKDPEGVILDKHCRDFPTGSPVSGGGEQYAPGYGSCGLTRFYNSSAPQDTVANNPYTPLADTVRAVHWTGVCMHGRCMECNPNSNAWYGSNQGQLGKTCLNGRIVATATSDGTIRSLRHNSVAAGAITAATFIGVLVVGFFIYTMYDANRHRAMFGKPPLSCMELLVDTCQVWQCCKCCGASEEHRTGVTVRMMGSSGGAVTNNPVADWDGHRRASAAKSADASSPHPPMQSGAPNQQPLVQNEGGSYGAVPPATAPGAGFH